MRFSTIFFVALNLLVIPAEAQQDQPVSVTGTVIDADDDNPIPGATAQLWTPTDSTTIDAGVTDASGRFVLATSEPGSYLIRISFVGYEPHIREINLTSADSDIGTVRLQSAVIDIDEVIVEEVQERYRMNGDTTVFNSAAYQVNPDASAEDLVGKLPGVVVGQDGTVEAQGEQVQRVMVDGREFFASDPSVALRNLPADIIQSIEVYDRQSDQAQFTGVDDGEEEKTINIVTKPESRNGMFGKVYSGYGEDERYIAGGNANIFDEDRRITILGLSNNVNRQNFVFEDLLDISGPDGGGGGRRGRGSDPRRFLRGQRGGLNHTSSLGVDYRDDIGESLELSGSYFFNRMENSNETLLDRRLFLSGDDTQLYNETSQSASTNYNHRLTARIEYEIDDNNSLRIRPRISFQDNEASSLDSGFNRLDSGMLLNESNSRYVSESFGYTSSTDILYRHRFPKDGRTISAELGVGLNDRWGETDQFSVTQYYEVDEAAEDSTYDQLIDDESAGRSFELELDYTEPIGEYDQLQISYEPSWGKDVSDRLAYVQDLQTGDYVLLDPRYSSRFDNNIFRQNGGITYEREIDDRYELQIGVEVQNERLLGDQTYPVDFTLDRSFFSVLPEAELELELGEETDIDIDYRTDTDVPSVSQLQDVIDNTNPLFLRTGNPDLRPSYSHDFGLRGRHGDWREGRMFFAFASFEIRRSPIGTSSQLAVRDTVLANGVTLEQGSQFSYPVNLDDPNLSARSYLGFGTPFPMLQSNLDFRGGISWSRTPGLVNDIENTATRFGFNGGVNVESNVSERLDFTLSYGSSYTTSSNTSYTRLDERFYRHDAGVRFTWLPVGGLVLETGLTYNEYFGLDERQYPTTFIMNAGIGYKFLQQDAAELRLVVGDIFNQEDGISRSVTDAYVQDRRTQVLGRYVLLNLRYKFRDFGR